VPKVKVKVKRRSSSGVKVPIMAQEFKLQGRVNKALASVHASMAVEGLQPDKITIALGRQFLEGKISGQEAIARIKARYLAGIRND
jgi:hypothetical protein